MISSILGILGSSAGGALTGMIQSAIVSASANKERDKERTHDLLMADKQNFNEFQANVYSNRVGVKKETTEYGEAYFFGWRFGRASTKVRYRVIGNPTSYHIAILMWMLAFAYLFVILSFASDSSIPIHSFAATPDTKKWSIFFGLLGYSSEENNIYGLTTGGLILPLLYPAIFILSKWSVGTIKSK